MTECLRCDAYFGGAEVVEGKVLLGNVSRVNKRCHKNVVSRLNFRAEGPLLVAAERAFWLRDLIDPSVRNRMLAMLTLGLEGRGCLVSSRSSSAIGCHILGNR